MKAPTYCLELYGAYTLFDIFQKKKFTIPKIPIGYIFLIAYFFITLLSIFLSEEWTGVGRQIEKRLSFVLIPSLLLLRRKYLTTETVKSTFYFFVLGCLTSSVVDFVRAFYRSIFIFDGHIMFNAAVVDGKSFSDSIVYGGNYFFYEDYSWFMHPTYFSFYILFAICIIFSTLYFKMQTKTKSWVLIALCVWFLFNIYLLSSRAVLICTLLVLSVWIFLFLKRFSMRKMLYGGILLTLIVIVIIVSNPRINLLFRVGEFFDNNQRLTIWKAGMTVIKSNFLWGTGVLDMDKDMEKACNTLGFIEGAQLKYNLHNQYLETLAASGVFGLISLLTLLIGFLKEATKNGNYLLLQFVLIVSFNFLFESMLSVYSGIVFICFWSCLLVNYQPGLDNSHMIKVDS